MGKDKSKGFDSTVKSGLSPGFKTDVYSRLDQLLFDKKVEFYGDIQDKYIKLAVTSYLDDLNFTKKNSEGRYIYVSAEKGIYKFIDDRPDSRVYDLPMEWDSFTMKISSLLEDNPLEVKVDTINQSMTSQEVLDIQETLGIEQEVRKYFIDNNNNRYYKGYTIVEKDNDGVEIVLCSYDNEIVIEQEWDEVIDSELFFDEEDKEKFIKTLTLENVDEPIFNKSSSFSDDERTEIKIYDSSKDGLLKSQVEIEIDGLKDILDEKGFATLKDGRIVVTDKDKLKDHFGSLNEDKSKSDTEDSDSPYDNLSEDELLEIREEFEDDMGYELGNDFLFAIGDATDLGTDQDFYLVIQPKSYWDNDGCQYDQHVEFLTRIPNGLYEVMESTFEYVGNIEDRIKDLVDSGFKFQDDFQEFTDPNNTIRVNNGMTIRQYVDTL